MYRCALCNTVPPAGTPAHRVVLETRPAEYPSRAKAQRMRVGRKMKYSDDPGGAGYEIAREALACPACASEHRTPEPEETDDELTQLQSADA